MYELQPGLLFSSRRVDGVFPMPREYVRSDDGTFRVFGVSAELVQRGRRADVYDEHADELTDLDGDANGNAHADSLGHWDLVDDWNGDAVLDVDSDGGCDALFTDTVAYEQRFCDSLRDTDGIDNSRCQSVFDFDDFPDSVIISDGLFADTIANGHGYDDADFHHV
jgi:hypothetical protein